MPQVYNLPQTVFMLSEGSNYLFSRMLPLAKLQSDISAFIGPGGTFYQTLNAAGGGYPVLIGGDWDTVWGPVVYQAPGNLGATNVMYVAHSESQQVYVVAIAGTNPTGWFALTNEDLKVGPSSMVLWPPKLSPPGAAWPLSWTSPNPANIESQCCIDQGTSDGLNILYNMSDPKKGPLSEYLTTLFNNGHQQGQTLIFTGHSLGGALSPTLAMLLYPQAAQSGAPNQPPLPPAALKSQWSNVYILATAGPSPGTQAFAESFCSPANQIPPASSVAPVPVQIQTTPPTGLTGPYSPVPTNAPQTFNSAAQFTYWNVIYANVYDVVPRAWDALAGLIEQHPTAIPLVHDYPCFFAAGSTLDELVGKPLYDAVNHFMNVSGYNGGASNSYYYRCLPHIVFNGAQSQEWGSWQSGSTTYPAQWNLSLHQPPISGLQSVDVFKFILNAHLDQYSRSFLGYPAPAFGEALPPEPTR
jgi:hypothetical protein